VTERIDPKELKILSDILALVLEDQAGQANNALEAIRARARRNKTTGGALKNLFVAIAPEPPARAAPRPRATRATAGASAADMQAARTQIRTLTENIRQLDLDLRMQRAENASLQSQLVLTQQARAETQAALMSVRSGAPSRRIGLSVVALTVGVLVGIAGTELTHTLTGGAVSSNAIYLH